MNYSKPEVKMLGEATMVIESTHTKSILPKVDGVPPQFTLNPAYDLDE
jgi:hypothetical protein